jgi:hypothetical protein
LVSNSSCKAGSASVLAQQPDFLAQKEWLQEVVESYNDCMLDYYPKFHCEFNFIELYWGEAKSYARRHCDYSFSGMQQTVPVALDSVSVALIRKYARKCYRYMDVYRSKGDSGTNLTMKQVEYAMKEFKSHRSIPSSILDL